MKKTLTLVIDGDVIVRASVDPESEAVTIKFINAQAAVDVLASLVVDAQEALEKEAHEKA